MRETNTVKSEQKNKTMLLEFAKILKKQYV